MQLAAGSVFSLRRDCLAHPETLGRRFERMRIQSTCIGGSGTAKVSSRGENTPNAPRAFAEPRAYLSQSA
jgi:hypothetical protein